MPIIISLFTKIPSGKSKSGIKSSAVVINILTFHLSKRRKKPLKTLGKNSGKKLFTRVILHNI